MRASEDGPEHRTRCRGHRHSDGGGIRAVERDRGRLDTASGGLRSPAAGKRNLLMEAVNRINIQRVGCGVARVDGLVGG